MKQYRQKPLIVNALRYEPHTCAMDVFDLLGPGYRVTCLGVWGRNSVLIEHHGRTLSVGLFDWILADLITGEVWSLDDGAFWAAYEENR